MNLRIQDWFTISRIVLSPFLLILDPFSIGFLVLFLILCLTDVIDGQIARRSGSCTGYGQILDSIADVVLVIVITICLIPYIEWKSWMIVWILSIFSIWTISFMIGSIRFRKFAFVHTLSNKASGLVLFLSIFLIDRVSADALVAIACVVTSISALEYLLIVLTVEELDPEMKSIVFRP